MPGTEFNDMPEGVQAALDAGADPEELAAMADRVARLKGTSRVLGDDFAVKHFPDAVGKTPAGKSRLEFEPSAPLLKRMARDVVQVRVVQAVSQFMDWYETSATALGGYDKIDRAALDTELDKLRRTVRLEARL